MLDLHKIRTEKEAVKTALLKRLAKEDFNLDEILNLDDERKELIRKIDNFKSEKNKYSKTKPSPEIIARMKAVGEKIKLLEIELSEINKNLEEKLIQLPNLPATDVLAGGKENNKVVNTFKIKPKFDFKPKSHLELASSLNIVDYQRAARMAGSGFWIYQGQGAQLEWALLNYFIGWHLKNGYTFILPPYLLSEPAAFVSGHLPKFRDDLYWTQDNLCLNATSEMMLLNLHAHEILTEEQLPLKYFAYSPCFRREGGGYRREERGMIRGHQFNKVEMFQFAKPEDSWSAFEQMVQQAEKLLEKLDLHFQSTQLAAADCSLAMAKTVDVEVWLPTINSYKEVSSVSNALDYQARRGQIRYKNKKTKKNEYLHTLNGSGLATSRLLPAILEQYQRPDGSVEIPKVLRPYLDFNEIKPKK